MYMLLERAFYLVLRRWIIGMIPGRACIISTPGIDAGISDDSCRDTGWI